MSKEVAGDDAAAKRAESERPLAMDDNALGAETDNVPAPNTRPSLWRRAAHIYALYGLGTVQTLLAVFGANQNYWAVRGSGAADIVVFLAVVLLVIPGILIAIELLAAAIDERAGWFVHIGLMVLVVSTFFVELAGTLVSNPASGWIVIVAGVAASVLLVYAYTRTKIVRDLLLVLAFTPVVFAVMFWMQLPPLSGNEAPPVDVGISDPTDVVVVVLDEFSLPALETESGAIDETRFPNFARLADMATWYPNASSIYDGTLYSVSALLSGNIPEAGAIPIATQHPTNLFTALQSTHSMQVYELATRLCPDSLCANTRQSDSILEHLESVMKDSGVVYLHSLIPADVLDHLPIPEIGIQWGDFLDSGTGVIVDETSGAFERQYATSTDGERRAAKIGRFIDTVGTLSGPTLYYLHIDVPHVPFTLLEDGTAYESVGALTKVDDHEWTGEAWERSQALARYSSSIGFADMALGDLLDRMEATGILEDSMLVVVSDHGVSFVEGEPRRLVSAENFGALVNVPLFIKYPGQIEGTQDESYADLSDVFETIVTAQGGEVLTDGDPLQTASERPPPEQVAMRSRGGPEVVFSWNDYLTSIERTRRELGSMVTMGQGHGQLTASAGPYPDIVGLDVGLFGGERVDGVVDFHDSSGIDGSAVSQRVPGLVIATVSGIGADGPSDYALVAGERIVATGVASRRGDDAYVEFFVGANGAGVGDTTLTVMAITNGADGETQLHPIGGS